MSELAHVNRSTGELATPGIDSFTPSDTTVSLVEWAQELRAAGEIAGIICNTEFVPKNMRGNQEATAAAILTGKELGFKPMAALSNVFVVQGRPGMYARSMVALVLQHGHEIIRAEATERTVTVRARRHGSTQWQEFTWTIERATKAGYASNAKYKTDPIGMLTAKAQAEACRTIAPDVLTGMPATTIEEIHLGDFQDGEVEDATPAVEAPKKVTTIKRKPAAKAPAPTPPPALHHAPPPVDPLEAPAPTPPPAIHEAPAPVDDVEDAETEDDEPAPEPEAQAPEKSTRSQWARLSNALEAIGVTEKTAKADEMRDWAQGQGLDRDITSAADLTSNETEAFIKELAEIAAASQQTEEDQP